MENNKPNVIITEGHSDAIRLLKKIHANSYYPMTASRYLVFHDPAVAQSITEEAEKHTKALEAVASSMNLVIVSNDVGKPYLHHPIPKQVPFIASFHDMLEDRIGDSKISEKIIEKKLDISNIVVSLQSNNQKH